MNRSGILCILLVLATVFSLRAQQVTRSGTPVTTAHEPLNVGCGGTTLFNTDAESGLPAGWNIIDGDTLDPMPTTGLGRGWQIRQDYRDTSNKVFVNCSFTNPAGTCDDWLISPLTTIGANGCLSWKVYSQDNYYLESYEIWVGSAPDTASLKLGTQVYSTSAASSSVRHLSIDLSSFSGQTVCIGFRHISTDKFVLALDDIRLTSRFEPDAWAYDLDTTNVMAFQEIFPQLVVANAGTDTLTSFTVNYQVNGGTIYSMTRTGLVMGTGDSVRVIHDSSWTPATLGTYQLCMWVSAPNGLTDANMGNDTICHVFQVTTFIGLDSEEEANWRVYPTLLASPDLNVSGLTGGTWLLSAPDGRTITEGIVAEEIFLPLMPPAGLYFLKMCDDSGRSRQFRILVP